MNYSRLSVSERRTLPPAVAVSTVAFSLRPPAGAVESEPGAAPKVEAAENTAREATLWLPLVRRTRAPFVGQWALPGGPIAFNETLVDTAVRTLRAAVQRDPGYLEQLYSFGAIERSAEAQRLVTIAYWALYGEGELGEGAGAARTAGTASAHAQRDPNVAWFSADSLPQLAFDHTQIVHHALDRLRSKTEYSTVAFRFLGESFTLAQLREVREAILGEAIDPANFRRQALAHGHLVETGAKTRGGRHRPAKLYRFREHQPQPPRPALHPATTIPATTSPATPASQRSSA